MTVDMAGETAGPRVRTAPAAADDFASFYEASFGPLVAQLYALTGDLGEAQEAAQEAFIRLWSRWPRVSKYDNPHAWLRTVGQRVAVSRWRQARRAVTAWLKYGPPADLPEPEPTSVALVDALRRLPDAQRRCLVAHYMGGLSVAEIAATERCATNTVKSRLSRGRAALAEYLRNDPSEENDHRG